MSGVPVVFLHGFLGCAEDFDAVRRALPERRTLALDLPGHGADPIEVRGATFADGVAQLREQIAALGLGRFDLVGYSMGGRLALALAAEPHGPVRRGAVVGAHPGLAGTHEREQRREADRQWAEQLERLGLDAFLERWYEQELFAPLRAHPGFETMLRRRRRGHARSLARALRVLGTGAQPDLGNRLATAHTPLLFVAGGLDAKFAALGEQLAARCPAVRSATIAGCGHAVHVEAPRRLAALLREHL